MGRGSEADPGHPDATAAPVVDPWGVTTVRDDDPDLLALLRGAPADPTAVLGLADWLAERADPRADPVRQLGTSQPVLPVARPDRAHDYPMVAAPEWSASLRPTGVTARVYPGTVVHAMVTRFIRPVADVRVPADRQSREALLRACEQCRLKFLAAVFGLTVRDLKGWSGECPATASAERRRWTDHTRTTSGRREIPWRRLQSLQRPINPACR